MVNEGAIEAGSELGYALGEMIYELTHAPDRSKPAVPYISFVLRNCTHDDLHDRGSRFEADNEWWKQREPPATIRARTTVGFIADIRMDSGTKVEGSLWYKIGNGNGQINIDFRNALLESKNTYRVYTDREDRYSIHWEGEHNSAPSFEIKLGYNYHDTQLDGTWLHESPAVVRFSKDNKLYCLFHGDNGADSLFYKAYDGSNWSGDTEAKTSDGGRMIMAASAAAVEFQGKIFCLYQGIGNNELWNATFDGNSWLGNWGVGARLSSTPTGVVYKDKLYCLFQGHSNLGNLYCRIHDGSKWSYDIPIRKDNIMSDAPSAIVWHDKLYCFFQGPNFNGTLNYMIFDGNSWSDPIQIQKVGMSRSPSTAIVNGKIRIYHQSYQETGHLWYIEFEGTEGDVPVVCVGMSFSPSVAMYNDKIHCLHHGWAAKRELWHVQLPLDH